MPRAFCYDRRESYFADQDIAADHRFALMRWSAEPTPVCHLIDQFDRLVRTYKSRLWDGVGSFRHRPDRKRQKRGHRAR